MSENKDKDWVEILVSWAQMLGMNPTRVRWRLLKWQDRWKASGDKAKLRSQQIRYQHRVCASCGSVADRSSKVCSRCGEKFLPRFIEVFQRFGILSPSFLTPTSLILTLVFIAYYRSATFQGGSLISPSTYGLVFFGANFPPAVWAGEWWRIGTSVFLHGDPIHLLFNLMALKQVGPAVEEIFGKGRMLFFFMLTGILASLGSAVWREAGVGIGASGALMGLVGLAAGWGHKDGGGAGKNVRDMMVKWGLYTVVFGFFIGADNTAHIVGLLSGFIFGLVARPARDKRGSKTLQLLEKVFGAVLFLLTAYLVNFPPQQFLTEPGIESPMVAEQSTDSETVEGMNPEPVEGRNGSR